MSLRHYHLAQVNIARILAPLDSDIMAGFMGQLVAINALADSTPGFVWRLQTPQGDATSFQPYEDPSILINLSVWESIESLKEFTYRSGHRTPLRDRLQWFEKPTAAHMTMWWIPAGEIPTVKDAVERLDFMRQHGETPVAFTFPKPYPMPDEPTADPKPLPVSLDQKLFVTASNTPNGDTDSETRFRYRQAGDRVWATYGGGRVRFGSLVAVGDHDGRLDMRYHHVGPDGSFRTGVCIATPEPLSDGRLRLVEEWQWTNGDQSKGRSVVEEAFA